MATVLNCSEDQACAHIERSELARRNFVRAHFDRDINDPHLYDLVINSDHLSPGTAARIVVTALLERLKSLSEQPAAPAFATT